MFLKKTNQNKFFIHLSFLLFFSLFFSTGYGQNGVAINTTGALPDNSAILDLTNVTNSKGLLLPKVTATSGVTSPATGLVVYQTGGNPGIYCNIGTSGSPNWILLSSSTGTVTSVTANSPLSITGSASAPVINLTGIVSVVNGGTGVSAAGANLVFATPNGAAGAPGFRSIVAADLPSLAGNYIVNNPPSVQTPGTFNIAGSGSMVGLTSANAAINLNVNSGVNATNINTGTNTGTVNIGGTGPQAINIGAAFSVGPNNTINIGSNGDGSNTTTNIIGSSGVNINTISNRTTTIGSSASPIILIGNTAAAGTVSLGSTGTTTSLNGNTTAINGSAVNINIGNNKVTNINTLATSGAVNIGATAAATQAINIGVGVTGTSTITIGNISSDPVTTNILSGTGGVNINKTGTGSVTIGNTTGNLFLPKFATPGTILYSSAATGQIAATTVGTAGQVLTSGGASAPTWSSTLPSGSSAYIQNQSSSSQSANYWISGSASVGGATFNPANQLDVATSGANNNAIVATNTAASGGGAGDGADGFTAQSTGQGIYGFNANTSGTGIIGAGNNVASGGNYLVAGSGGAFTGNTTGIYAKYISTSNGSAALYTVDNVGNVVAVNSYSGGAQYKIIGSGTVSTVAENTDNKSKVVLHAPEAPEILFEDYGNGELVSGKAHVNIDPIFSKNIVVNDKHPLRVFIQLEGDCNGVYVTGKSKTGFDVVELQKGNSNVSFQWHIVCNRANEDLGNGKISYNEDMRFEQAPISMQNLSAEKVLQKIKKS